MNRAIFIARLRELLADVTEAEREEAISYYEEYFEDAGVENEQSVIESLGSPEKVAATIKAGLNENTEDGEFTETGYSAGSYENKDEVAERMNGKGFKKGIKMSTGGWILILILCIFALPILGPLLVGIGSVCIGIIAAIVAVFFAVLVVGIALVVTAIALVVAGVAALIATPVAGLALLGAALFVGGLGILISILGFWIVTKVVPPAFRGLINLCRKPFQKRGV